MNDIINIWYNKSSLIIRLNDADIILLNTCSIREKAEEKVYSELGRLNKLKKINPNLTEEQQLVLFEEGTELAGTSELNHEKREGSFHCANCGEKLFDSNTKYESGSGWPSFYQSLPDVFETKTDHHLGYARTEYHCKKCGGHHGHIFEDGPEPTGKRYCNNGVCLTFKTKD